MLIVLRLPNIIFLFEFLRSMVFTTASVPLQGDRNLRRKDVTALLGAICSKTYPSFLTVKEGSTSHLGLLPSGKKRKTALQCYICPTCPSPAGGSLTHSQALALSKRARDVTAPSRCSEPLRSKVGGPSKVFARLCGMGPPSYYLAKGAGYYPYFKTTLACNKSQRERNVFNV